MCLVELNGMDTIMNSLFHSVKRNKHFFMSFRWNGWFHSSIPDTINVNNGWFHFMYLTFSFFVTTGHESQNLMIPLVDRKVATLLKVAALFLLTIYLGNAIRFYSLDDIWTPRPLPFVVGELSAKKKLSTHNEKCKK